MTAMKNIATGEGRVSEMSGKGSNNLKPNPNASGDHSSFKKGGDGKITNTATYKQNSKNPTGFDEVKRVDVKGSSHKKILVKKSKHLMFMNLKKTQG